ncbi:gamma-glutamyl-gamma-aminobutyrate hydrolase family protein [Psychrosphaera aquimarina]|uniref:anthranilate synthase n=1 Tax=Psychrosphaera aquimarina TaxID=2044854 RepID=A0ABU3QVZ7_9GAMM|nr:gamma-glutamyl-gamma-aminobutyrate hydrolase family protein [Psychrosphaera aquimarina]MDU0111598.1 gamma-glutamyl-gamma-aminobutyrate hydrolase family protein [Psychrosphaera aquimarina]
MSKIFLLDNQDSFTYNLVDELRCLDNQIEIFRNTVNPQMIIDQINNSIQAGEKPLLFLSPGPGKPSDSVCMTKLIEYAVGTIPIIGVCLGHQAIAEHYGAIVTLAGETVHGKSSVITCQPHEIFDGLGTNMSVARYHSLIVKDLPSDITVIGQLGDIPMVFIDEKNKTLGFQFHPESILTTDGSRLLEQAINYLTK